MILHQRIDSDVAALRPYATRPGSQGHSAFSNSWRKSKGVVAPGYEPPVESARYHGGEIIRIGDHAESLAHGPGTVVHVIVCARPRPGFANAAWSDLETGLLVRESDGVLTHYRQAPAALRLVARETGHVEQGGGTSGDRLKGGFG